MDLKIKCLWILLLFFWVLNLSKAQDIPIDDPPPLWNKSQSQRDEYYRNDRINRNSEKDERKSKQKNEKNHSSILKSFFLELGIFSPDFNKYQKDDQGNKYFLDPSYLLGIKTRILVGSQWYFSPQTGFTLPEKGRDENITKFYYYTFLNMEYLLSDFSFTLGSGLLFTHLSSSGAEYEELQNGLATEQFPLPQFSTTARNWIINIGAHATLFEDFHVGLQSQIFNFYSGQNRTLSIMMTLGYDLGPLF